MKLSYQISRAGTRSRLLLPISLIVFWLTIGFWPTTPSVRGSGLQPAAPRSQSRLGLFTEAQAERGEAVYQRRCATCHGAELQGASASALSGARFSAKWTNRNVDELYFITRTQMPYGAGGTLTSKQYIDSVSYILKANGYGYGSRELSADSAYLQTIKIEPQSGGKGNVTQTREVAEEIASARVGSSTSKRPSQEELNAAQTNTADWLVSNHDYSGQRFVDVKQINQQNVKSLRPACIYQSGDTKAFHNNPIVHQGVMYITTPTSTVAIDATTCRVRWRHDRKLKSIEVWPPNRGVAIKDGILVRGVSDGYLIALDMEKGSLLWEKKVVASEKNEGTFNMAPLIFEDMVLIGIGISEQGVRGWFGGFKLDTGELVWRFNTIPDKGEPGGDTWGDQGAELRGGGGVWAPLALDQELGLVYVPVANPAPDFFGDIRKGANLYTGSLIVLDARTGKLKWHYQAVPHDVHDWDLTQVSPLFTTNVGGKKRKLVALAGKDGLLTVLDRETRERLYETPVTTRSNADVPLTLDGVRVCPGVLGGVQWNGPAFNPGSNMLYVPAVDWCGVFKKSAEVRFVPGQLYMGGSHIAEPIGKARGWLTAVDASTGEVRWRYESSRPMLAAVTTTSASLVFAGELTGDLIALDAVSGKVLYRYYTGASLSGGIVTYAINGKQYVAAMSGSASGFWQAPPAASSVVVFSLP